MPAGLWAARARAGRPARPMLVGLAEREEARGGRAGGDAADAATTSSICTEHNYAECSSWKSLASILDSLRSSRLSEQ